MEIPVIDFGRMSLEKKPVNDCSSELSLQRLADEIYYAFSTVGFVYLENHGIPQEKVSRSDSPCNQGVDARSSITSKTGDNLFPKNRQPTEKVGQFATGTTHFRFLFVFFETMSLTKQVTES